MRLAARAALAALAWSPLLGAGVARAQSSQAHATRRLAEGRVLRPSAKAQPVPVVGQWVVLHRVGSDRAAPVDSAKSDAAGRYRIRYSPSGVPDALYFVSSRYGGIAYFSPPLRADTVRGGDADVMVYDTTPATSDLNIQGRHFVLSSPRAGGRREVAEVFEVDNAGFHTIVARDSITPIWTTHLPVEADSISVGPGDVTVGAVVFRQSRAEVFAPISPGVRQLVITYLLPAKAFPLSHPIERPVAVLEVLLEEPTAAVEGARLAEVSPALIDGRQFRRYLATDVPANAVMIVTVPRAVGQNRAAMRVLAVVVALAMLGAFAVWYVRRRAFRIPSGVRHPASDVERMIAELAALDARFEKQADGHAEYEQQRARLKAQIARALAEAPSPV